MTDMTTDTATDKWQPGQLWLATEPPSPLAGRVYRGLGLRKIFGASPKGRRPPRWLLQHLGTGHMLCFLEMHEAPALELAAKIAECGNWDFEGLRGWMNVDPDLKDKFRAIIDAHPGAIKPGRGAQSETFATAVAMARA